MLPSSSKLYIVEQCPGAGALKAYARETAAAGLGTAVHAFLQDVNRFGRDQALGRIADEELGELCAAIDLSRLPVDAQGYAAEVSLAYDSEKDTARELARGKPRQYAGALQEENCCTVDVLALAGQDGVFVGDYKLGGFSVAKAADNLQLLTCCLYAARAYGRSRAVGEIIRIFDDGSSWHDRIELDAFALDQVAERVRNINGWVHDARNLVKLKELPRTVIGDWCRWCDCLPGCPAHMQLIQQAVVAPEAVKDRLNILLDADSAGRAWEVLKGLKTLVGHMEQALYAFAAQTPIKLRNGMWLRETVTKKEYIKGRPLHALLEEHYGRAVADAAVELSASKKDLKAALRPAARAHGMTLKAAYEGVLSELRNVGGIEKKEYRGVKECGPPELEGKADEEDGDGKD